MLLLRLSWEQGSQRREVLAKPQSWWFWYHRTHSCYGWMLGRPPLQHSYRMGKDAELPSDSTDCYSSTGERELQRKITSMKIQGRFILWRGSRRTLTGLTLSPCSEAGNATIKSCCSDQRHASFHNCSAKLFPYISWLTGGVSIWETLAGCHHQVYIQSWSLWRKPWAYPGTYLSSSKVACSSDQETTQHLTAGRFVFRWRRNFLAAPSIRMTTWKAFARGQLINQTLYLPGCSLTTSLVQHAGQPVGVSSHEWIGSLANVLAQFLLGKT